MCTQAVCYGSCSIYGSGHYITFDGKHYDFDGHCSYVAVQVRPAAWPCPRPVALHHVLKPLSAQQEGVPSEGPGE